MPWPVTRLEPGSSSPQLSPFAERDVAGAGMVPARMSAATIPADVVISAACGSLPGLVGMTWVFDYCDGEGLE